VRAHLREAEVEELGVAARADKNVCRLDVAVDDIRGMGGVQCVGDLDPQLQHRIKSEWTVGESVLQRRALQILHGDERSSVLFADVVDRANVRVVERRRRLRFAREPAQRLGIL
jgi:hypothetical protein